MPKITLEQLAVMVANGFAETATKKDLKVLRLDLKSLELRLGGVEIDVKSLKQGQEDIILRLDQMAPNFDVKDLKKRVTKIEKVLKIA